MQNNQKSYDEIIDLYEDGMTEAQIAKKLGIDIKLVESAIESYNDCQE